MKALECKNKVLTKERKEKIAKVLIPELMSSEDEQEYSDGEKYFLVKPLPWISDKFLQIKSNLDETYYAEIETKKGKDQRKMRESGQPSTRPRPEYIQPTAWIFKQD